jgi:hypothetical protein
MFRYHAGSHESPTQYYTQGFNMGKIKRETMTRREMLALTGAAGAALACGLPALGKEAVLPADDSSQYPFRLGGDRFPEIGAELVEEVYEPFMVPGDAKFASTGEMVLLKAIRIAGFRLYRLRTRVPFAPCKVLAQAVARINDRPLLGWPAGQVMLDGVDTEVTSNGFELERWLTTVWRCQWPGSFNSVEGPDGTRRALAMYEPAELHAVLAAQGHRPG